jgi:hypothetical protein
VIASYPRFVRNDPRLSIRNQVLFLSNIRLRKPKRWTISCPAPRKAVVLFFPELLFLVDPRPVAMRRWATLAAFDLLARAVLWRKRHWTKKPVAST